MGTFLDGIGASQNIDSSGEIVDISGLDISSLEIDGSLNWEHKKDVPDQLVGKILKARKIFSKKDCEDDRQLHYWNKCQVPFLYILGELFDDYTDSARTVAGLLRYDADHRGKNERDIIGFSVEGAKLPGAQKGMTITHSIARKITLTNFPCNKMATAEMLPSKQKTEKGDIDNIFKTESFTEIEVIDLKKNDSFWDLLKKDSLMKKAKALFGMKKDVGGGGLSYGSSTGLGGSAPSSAGGLLCSEPEMARSEMAKAAQLKPVGPEGVQIGKTLRGKPIHSHARVGATGFDSYEHTEAAEAHQKAASKSKDPKVVNHHIQKAKLHQQASFAAKDRETKAKQKTGSGSPMNNKIVNPRLNGKVNYKKSEVLEPGQQSNSTRANQKQERARRSEEAYPNSDRKYFDQHKINHSSSNIGNVKRPSVPNKQIAQDHPEAGGPRNNELHNNILSQKFTNNKSEKIAKAGAGGGGFGGASTVGGVSSITSVSTGAPSAPKSPKKMPLGKITKALEAGSSLASPNSLVGGAALGKESLERKIKKAEGNTHAKVGDTVHLHMPGEKEKIKGVVRNIHTKEMGMGGKDLHPDKHMAHVEITENGQQSERHLKGHRYFAPAKFGNQGGETHITPHSENKLKKSIWLQRAEAEYANWEKREEFEKYMSEKLPSLTRSEIRVIGQTMLLNKSMRAEDKLAKMSGLAPKVSNAPSAEHEPAHHNDFHQALSHAQNSDPKVKEFVHRYEPHEYAKMKTFLHPDKKSGFAVKPDGDIVSVFSTERGRGDQIVNHAKKVGGNKLDAFDGYLPKLYSKHGFQEYRREKNWNPGGPDVVYMHLPHKK